MTPEEFIAEWRNSAPCVEVRTSGSTGEPKLIKVEKLRMENSALTTCRFLGLHRGDSALLCMPVDFIAGKMMVVRAETCGLRLTCVDPSGHPLASLSDDVAFDLVAMVPMQVHNTMQIGREREILKRVRHLIIGGGAVSEELATLLRDFPNAVWSTYGMTETLSHIALRRLNGPDASEWYTPFDAVEVWLNSKGCLVISAPNICEAPIETHDLAEIAPDGRRFRIIGRLDNVICSGGLKIQIEEVEERLRPMMPCEFMITRRKDEKYGEACVMLYAGDDIDAVKRACEALPRHHRPKAYIHVDELPSTPTGKPARAAAERLANCCLGAFSRSVPSAGAVIDLE